MVVVTGVLITAIDTTIVVLALPEIQRSLYIGLASVIYRRKSPPPALLRLLGPFVVVLTIAVLGSGIALLLGPVDIRSEMLQLHKATFILWFGAMTLHVLGHFVDTTRLAPRDFSRRTRSQVRGAGTRQWVLVGSLCLGLVLGWRWRRRWGRGWRNGRLSRGPPVRGPWSLRSASSLNRDAADTLLAIGSEGVRSPSPAIPIRDRPPVGWSEIR